MIFLYLGLFFFKQVDFLKNLKRVIELMFFPRKDKSEVWNGDFPCVIMTDLLETGFFIYYLANKL